MTIKPKPSLHVVPPGGSSQARRKPLRIVVCDDERDTANLLALVLRDEGHEVQIALRGDDALDLCRLFRPDVVIADVNMPGMSGYGIAHELRERHGPLAPLLIAMSGVWTSPSDRTAGVAAGFDHYLLKPCDPKEVMALLDEMALRQAADRAG